MAAVGFVITLAVALAFGLTGDVVAQEQIKPGKRRIVGGQEASIKDHRWQIALQFQGAFACGGSIVADRWILTAAHCFNVSAREKDWRVRSGATGQVGEGSWKELDKIVVHRGYDPTTFENDIALVRTKSLLAGGNVIELASDDTGLLGGQLLEITGWGATQFGGGGSAKLLKASVPYVDAAVCNASESYDGRIKGGMLCAGFREGGVDACQGDSGGPLVSRTSGVPVLIGVVSFGERCAERLKYGVYTRVSAYRSWIDSVFASQAK